LEEDRRKKIVEGKFSNMVSLLEIGYISDCIYRMENPPKAALESYKDALNHLLSYSISGACHLC